MSICKCHDCMAENIKDKKERKRVQVFYKIENENYI